MTVQIRVSGPIIQNGEKWIYDWFDEEATCPKDVLEALPANGEDVEVTINSYGGYVDQGNEIYTALKSYQGAVTTTIIMAGSAASIIAMGGDHVRMTPPGQIMIHNVAMGSHGDYHAMDKASEILQKSNQSLAMAYQLKTGMSEQEVLKKMDEETWLTAKEAKEQRFIDEIMFENEERPLLVADGGTGMLSKNMIGKMKELINQQEKQQNQLTVKLDMTKVQELINESITELKRNTVIEGKTLQEWMDESAQENKSNTELENEKLSKLLFY